MKVLKPTGEYADLEHRFARIFEIEQQAQKTISNYRKQITNRMKGIRVASGMSLRALAQKMGISAMYLSDMENGKRNYTSEMTMKALNGVGYEIEWMQVKEKEPQP